MFKYPGRFPVSRSLMSIDDVGLEHNYTIYQSLGSIIDDFLDKSENTRKDAEEFDTSRIFLFVDVDQK